MFGFHCHRSLVSWYRNLGCRFTVIPILPVILKWLVWRRTQTIFWKMENSMLKRYGHIICMEDDKWYEWIMICSMEGWRRRGWHEVKWGKGVERIRKQSNLTTDDATYQQIWRLKISNQWTTGKLIEKQEDCTLIYFYFVLLSCLRVLYLPVLSPCLPVANSLSLLFCRVLPPCCYVEEQWIPFLNIIYYRTIFAFCG